VGVCVGVGEDVKDGVSVLLTAGVKPETGVSVDVIFITVGVDCGKNGLHDETTNMMAARTRNRIRALENMFIKQIRASLFSWFSRPTKIQLKDLYDIQICLRSKFSI
jgi:hypothetical protein